MTGKEEKKGKDNNDELEAIIKKLDEPTKGYILIVTDNTSGLTKDAKPDGELTMKSNLIDPLVAYNIQKVLVQLRERGA